jgi:hypothetical protein
MHFVQKALFYLGIVSLAFLIVGLFKPWLMLWWEDLQNRRKVIKVYGIIAITCLVVQYLIGLGL